MCLRQVGDKYHQKKTPTGCDARLSYRDERTFAAMMDDSLSSTAAVATGRLRVSGSLRLASASEGVYVAAEAWLRDRYGDVVRLSEEQAEANPNPGPETGPGPDWP